MDSEFEAFCIDFFPAVHQVLSQGMDRIAKTNCLLVKADVTEILAALEYRPGRSEVERAMAKLRKERLTRSPHPPHKASTSPHVDLPQEPFMPSPSSSPSGSPLRIVIAGRANSGKTTLVRTLLKVAVGDVKDKAGVTDVAQEYDYRDRTGLPAIFIDTPGFLNAQKLVAIYDFKAVNPSAITPPQYKNTNDKRNKLDHDRRALQAIQGGDVVVYVASLEATPDEIAISEIELITRITPRIVAVLNKASLVEQHKEEQKANRKDRLSDWSMALKEAGIETVIDFDAHWDRPSKITDIYQAIAKALSGEKQKSFLDGLKAFDKNQAVILVTACEAAATCVESCISSLHEYEGDHSHDEGRTKANLQKAISKQIQSATEIFASTVSDLYRIRTASKNSAIADEQIVHSAFTKLWDAAKGAVIVGVPVGGIGALIGAGIGAIVAGALSGGLGAAGGAMLGAEIGGAIAGAFGSVTGTAIEYKAHQTARLSERAVYEIECSCLATIWALSHHGFGLRQSITLKQLEKLTDEVRKRVSISAANNNGHQQRVKRYKQVLSQLEDVTV